MDSNLDRFKKDAKKLLEFGNNLNISMHIEVTGTKKAILEEISKAHGDKAKDFIKKLPKFKQEYEAWYSESLALLKQVLPDRVNNFTSLYEKPKNRKELSYETYVMQDYLQGLVRENGLGQIIVDTSAGLNRFEQQLNILNAANKRFESSLFEIRQLVQADLFDSEIDAARELLKNKFLRAAGAIAGVVIEKHLRQVCEDRSITIAKKDPSISDLNDLLKKIMLLRCPSGDIFRCLEIFAISVITTKSKNLQMIK